MPNARALGGGQADFAHADHTECLAQETVGVAVCLLVPDAGPEVGGSRRDVAIHGEKEAEGQLGHGYRVGAGHVAHVDAGVGRRLAVDGVGAGARPNDEAQVVGTVDGLGCDPGATDDQHVEAPDGLGEILGTEIGRDDALVAPLSKNLDERLGDRVGEQDLHGCSFGTPTPAQWVRTAG